MKFDLFFARQAKEQMDRLSNSNDKKMVYSAVCKTLALMRTNLRHPSLNTHEYKNYGDIKVFESYVQNRTPGAYRIFWHYGPDKGNITVLDICPHP